MIARGKEQEGTAPGPQSVLPEVLLGSAVFVSACLAIELTKIPGGIALFWPCAAIAGAVLIRLPRVRWLLAGAVLWLAVFGASVLIAKRTWLAASLFAWINLVEIGGMVAAFRFAWPFPYPRISVVQATLMTMVYGIVIPGLTALLGAATLSGYYGMPLRNGLEQWWSSHAIGACLLGPAIILFNVRDLKRLAAGRFFAENALTFLVSAVGGYFLYRYCRFPFVSMALLSLLVSFRIGAFGAALLALASGLLVTNLWAFGFRPLGLESVSAAGTLIELPVIALLATVMPSVAVGLGSDARRTVARALKASERRFRDSMEHSPVGMLISDIGGIWTYSNIALQTMLGYTAAELRALPPGGPSDPEDWDSRKARWQPLIAGEIESYNTVRRFRHKDGHWIWTHVAVAVMRDEEGRAVSFIAQIESMEARRRAEEKLAEERERLKITLQSIDDAVVTTDAHTRITYINAAAEALLGLDVKAVEGRRVQELIHLTDAETAKPAANLLSQAALHGKSFRRTEACVLHRADASICLVTDIVSPVLDSNGFVTGLVIVLRDATFEADRDRDLRHRALHDPLTGLSNRADFESRLREIFRKTHHLERPAALFAIDLDRFKAVNDSAGHAAGDAMLRKVAEVCSNAVRSSDVVARLGGDEFAIILDKCGAAQAATIGDKLLRELNPLSLGWEGAVHSVGASIGIASRRADMDSEKDWLAAADKACYQAKHAGRGVIRVAEPESENVGGERYSADRV
jgi:diguanylate cyclase (GGDEF)-like protein/PAS domain S-box-containing protein